MQSWEKYVVSIEKRLLATSRTYAWAYENLVDAREEGDLNAEFLATCALMRAQDDLNVAGVGAGILRNGFDKFHTKKKGPVATKKRRKRK